MIGIASRSTRERSRPRGVPAGGSVRYDGGAEAVIADAAWKEVARVPVALATSRADGGAQRLTLRCASRPGGALKWEVRTYDAPRPVTASER